jgi:hypothetical protein
MPEARLQRTREGSKEVNCSHLLLITKADSDKAPFIESDGNRTTIKLCVYCGKVFIYTRSEEQFKKELDLMFGFLDYEL